MPSKLEESPEIEFKKLYEQQKTRVYNTALGFLQNATDAEDITQEVFIEIHRSLGAFGQRSSLSTWIYRITINKCIDHTRKKKRQKTFGFLSIVRDDEGEINLEAGHFDHPGIILENKEKSRILFAAIDILPENQKTAFILFHLEELSQKEIAEVMGTSPKAVESLVQRAKVSLREKLEKYYEKGRGK
jgi:RNA polymerase sigma factor (sigma-70 family)